MCFFLGLEKILNLKRKFLSVKDRKVHALLLFEQSSETIDRVNWVWFRSCFVLEDQTGVGSSRTSYSISIKYIPSGYVRKNPEIPSPLECLSRTFSNFSEVPVQCKNHRSQCLWLKYFVYRASFYLFNSAAEGRGKIMNPFGARAARMEPADRTYRFLTRLLKSGILRSLSGTLCVYVCGFSSHSFWISSLLDVPAGVTQEGGHTGGRSHRSFPRRP